MDDLNPLFEPCGALSGELAPPADKSIAHRAALFSAMGEGPARISNYLAAEDTLSTLAAIEALGTRVDRKENSDGSLELMIEGIGLDGPSRNASDDVSMDIDCGNAGTLIRLLSGWLAGQPSGEWILDGDESLRSRPMERIAEPLRLMGASVETSQGSAPIRISGSELHGISFESPIASAQLKSCLILAGLQAEGETEIKEPVLSRDHTERMLSSAGAKISPTETGYLSVTPQNKPLQNADVMIPGDFSSAAFFIVAATLVPGSRIKLLGVGVNPTRAGLVTVMRRMGAQIEIDPHPGAVGGDPIADLTVTAVPRLSGTDVGAEEIATLIDELPLVALLGVMADGTTTVAGAEELRHKESDRIATVVEGLSALGASISERPDGFSVVGSDVLRGGEMSSHGDHRLAMLGAISGLVSAEGVSVRGMDAAAVSYPTFIDDLTALQAGSSGSRVT